MVAGKGMQAEFFQRGLHNKPVGREETFSQRFLVNQLEKILVPTFSCSFRKSWKESPNS